MKTLLFGCFILLGLFSCNQNSPRNSNSDKTLNYSMSVLHQRVTNDLTSILSGYIEKSNETTNSNNIKFVISTIRFSGSTDFEFIQLGVNGYNAIKPSIGLSVYAPWTRDANRSYPSYTMSLKKDGSNDEFIILTYHEINNNKELLIASSIK